MVSNWFEEHDFWFKKSQRAYMRYELARDAGDFEQIKLQLKQFELCRRRMVAVPIPDEVKKMQRELKEEERQAALRGE